jgi:hypothetical protein
MLKRYGFFWVTGGFFLITLAGHWIFGWFAYVNEQVTHAQAISTQDYLITMMRDTLENWQSEFLQLVWQVGGLAMLLQVGSPQSKEGDDRMKAKLDAIILELSGDRGEKIIGDIDDAYEGRHTDAQHQERVAQRAEQKE